MFRKIRHMHQCISAGNMCKSHKESLLIANEQRRATSHIGVVKRATYENTRGRAPPYLMYVDHDARDIMLAIRGLNLAKESDYAILLGNRLGKQMFDGGYMHNGLLKSAGWLLNAESETLRDLIEKNPSYTLTFAKHALGSGVASLLTLVMVNNRDKLANIPRSQIRCYAIAPTRCMSLNLAVRYADIINSVVLQDDFLPRTTIPLEDIFKSLFCLPCLLCIRYMKDICTSEERKLRDPRGLYALGRLYHIVERKLCRCGRFPPEVKIVVPVEGRFKHIILSCNTISDHGIVWIKKEAQKALNLMMEREGTMDIPSKQRMERQETIAKEHNEEHKHALKRVVTLKVPHAFSPSYSTFDSERYETSDECKLLLDDHEDTISYKTETGEPSECGQKSKGKTDWNELIDKLFEKDASGKIVLRKGMDSVR